MPSPEKVIGLEGLFCAYQRQIYRYILSIVRDRGEAEDLTQDTYLRALRAEASLRDRQAVRGWLYSIATNACLDRLRQRKPQVSLDSEEGAERTKAAAATAPSAVEITERKETSMCVHRCLEFLPDTYRAAILLHEGHSLTAPEIADLLGVTVATVKIRLHRAHRKLQQIMEYGCTVSNDRRGLPNCQPKLKLPARTRRTDGS